MNDFGNLVENYSCELLERLGISYEDVTVVEEEEIFNVKVDAGEENGLIIGYHGENLDSFQHLVSLFVYRDCEEWAHILFDVGEYRQDNETRLRELAENAAKRARFLQEPVVLPPMSSYERRLVHMAVADVSGAYTESVGAGRGRQVVVKPGEGVEK